MVVSYRRLSAVFQISQAFLLNFFGGGGGDIIAPDFANWGLRRFVTFFVPFCKIFMDNTFYGMVKCSFLERGGPSIPRPGGKP